MVEVGSACATGSVAVGVAAGGVQAASKRTMMKRNESCFNIYAPYKFVSQFDSIFAARDVMPRLASVTHYKTIAALSAAIVLSGKLTFCLTFILRACSSRLRADLARGLSIRGA
jgi:hypothetical protein